MFTLCTHSLIVRILLSPTTPYYMRYTTVLAKEAVVSRRIGTSQRLVGVALKVKGNDDITC